MLEVLMFLVMVLVNTKMFKVWNSLNRSSIDVERTVFWKSVIIFLVLLMWKKLLFWLFWSIIFFEVHGAFFCCFMFEQKPVCSLKEASGGHTVMVFCVAFRLSHRAMWREQLCRNGIRTAEVWVGESPKCFSSSGVHCFHHNKNTASMHLLVTVSTEAGSFCYLELRHWTKRLTGGCLCWPSVWQA